MRRFHWFSRHSFGVRNRSPWLSMLGHSIHEFHENDLFTSSAAMSYFGLMALFPALLLMLAIGNQVAAGISGYGEFAEQVKAGKLRVIAISADNKPSILPIIATVNPKLRPIRCSGATGGHALKHLPINDITIASGNG